MKSPLTVLLTYLVSAHLLVANTDVRTWTDTTGSKFLAELVSYNEATETAILKFDDSEEREYPLDDFSAIDQAWLVEWVEFERDLDSLLGTLGGEVVHIVSTGDYPTDLYIYYPSLKDGQKYDDLPAMILFNAGGKAARFLKRHIEAAEASHLILIACGSFRNTGEDDTLEAQMLERFRNVFPYICGNIPFDKKRLFMGGNSGGAWRAYHYSAWVKWPWAGIYACGGWLGGKKYYKLEYSPNLRVAMVNGNNDTAANAWIEGDSTVLRKANAEIGIISFEGGHQAPPVHVQTKAFDWLLQQDDFVDE